MRYCLFSIRQTKSLGQRIYVDKRNEQFLHILGIARSDLQHAQEEHVKEKEQTRLAVIATLNKFLE